MKNENNLVSRTKDTNFRTWKSGKNWLYAASVLTALAGGAAVGEVAQAATTSNAVSTSTAASTSSLSASPTSASSSASTASVPTSSSTATNVVDLTNASTATLVTSSGNSSATAVATPVSAPATSAPATSGAVAISAVAVSAVSAASATSSTTAIPYVTASDLVNTVNNAANLTIGQGVTNLVDSAGVTGALDLATQTFNTLAPALSAVPALAGITSTIGQALSTISNVINAASAVGIPVNAINSMVATALVSVVNTAGQALNAAVSPILSGIPLVGSALNSFVSPILTNLAGQSISTVTSEAASAVGLSSVLNLVNGAVQFIEPGVATVIATALNAVTSALNTINSLASSVFGPDNFVSGIITSITNPIVTIANGVVAVINGPATVGSTAPVPPTSSSPSIPSAPTTAATITLSNIAIPYQGAYNVNSLIAATNDGTGQPINPSAITHYGFVDPNVPGNYVVVYTYTDPTTGAVISQAGRITVLPANGQGSAVAGGGVGLNSAALPTYNTPIYREGSYSTKDGLGTIVDSTGKTVDPANVSVSGFVDPNVPGNYYLIYSYTDSGTGKVVSNVGAVIVQSQTAIQSATSAVAAASSAVAADSASIEAIKSSVMALPATVSDLTSYFPSTSFASSATVVLPMPASSFAVDNSAVNSYFLSYVNQLRESNGLSDLVSSSSEVAFAATRASEIVTDFSHNQAGTSTENIGASGGLLSSLLSNQEIAYFMVMDWYDETDNSELLGAGHYGHRANLLYGGPSVGVYVNILSSADSYGMDEYHAMEAPTYTDQATYNTAVSMANSTTPPNTVPLPDLIFRYVDPTAYTTLAGQYGAATTQMAQDQATLAAAQAALTALTPPTTTTPPTPTTPPSTTTSTTPTTPPTTTTSTPTTV